MIKQIKFNFFLKKKKIEFSHADPTQFWSWLEKFMEEFK